MRDRDFYVFSRPGAPVRPLSSVWRSADDLDRHPDMIPETAALIDRGDLHLDLIYFSERPAMVAVVFYVKDREA